MRHRILLLIVPLGLAGCGPEDATPAPGGGGVVDAPAGDPAPDPAEAEGAEPEPADVPAETPPAEETGEVDPEVTDEPAEEPGGEGDDGEDEFNHAGQCCADGSEPEVEDPNEEATPDDDRPPGPQTVAGCFADIAGELGPDYDQFGPTVGSHCMGTNHQEIDGIEKVVFLGDSVTVGTPPTLLWDFYTFVLSEALQARFGDLEVSNCAKWGARTDDLLIGKGEIGECFPDGGSERRTLVVMTIGGNDIAAWAQDQLGVDEALAQAEAAADLLRDAIAWFHEPGRFPNGVSVVFASPYEYTDATGDVDSCPFAGFAGLEGNWIEGAPAVIRLHERFMQIAVESRTDIIFTLERFCGHGFHHDDPESQCYRGPDAELWFDLTCIHPNPTGHRVIAEMFQAVVEE